MLMVGRRPEYVPMVTSNWMSSSRAGNGVRVDRRVHDTYEHALIERYWRDPDFVWLFAANPADTNFVHGWLCGELTDVGPLLHYVYVRRRMRDTAALKLGVCEALMRSFINPVDYGDEGRLTHTRTTPAWEAWARRHLDSDAPAFGETFFNPYLAFNEFCPWRQKPCAQCGAARG